MHVAEYTWRLEKGHRVANIGGKRFLLSTGARRSMAVARRPEMPPLARQAM